MEYVHNNQNMIFPDFIIAGAMKCGTTSLHNILSTHPDIFIPEQEIHFFNIDDISQHPDFFIFRKNQWYFPNFNKNEEIYLKWYSSYFSNAIKGQIIGEDSTTYLASKKAPEKILKFLPNIKLIIMLRDPTSRAYSHYWHLVRTGRAIFDFEDSLQIMPENLLQRSLYKDQIDNFLDYFPRENIKFIIFEEFIRNIKRIIDEVCNYLNVNPDAIDINQIDTHHNPARIPLHINVQLWRNRIYRSQANLSYLRHLVEVPNTNDIGYNYPARIIDRLHKLINPQIIAQPPKMKQVTRKFLNQYFSKENNGLNEIINKNTNAYWYKD
jgi:hypothetical protein